MLKFAPVILAFILLLAAIPAVGQDSGISKIIDVPSSGYDSQDSYSTNQMFNEYRVYVPRANEMAYSVTINGTGTFSIYVIPEHGTEYVLQSSYYISFSSPQPVTEYSKVFPADFGFAQDLTIAINSTANITYDISIHLAEKDTSSYTPYYILLGLGVVGLVAFSWYFTKWQVRQEKLAEEKARAARRSKRGKRKR